MPPVVPADLDDPALIAMIAEHVQRARAATPRLESSHALPVDALRDPRIAVFAIRDETRPLAVGALKSLGPTEAEIKSMFTADDVRGRGLGRAMLRHLIAFAQASGVRRLYLETGAGAYFARARRLYAAHGFVVCAPFGEYVDDPESAFMLLELATI